MRKILLLPVLLAFLFGACDESGNKHNGGGNNGGNGGNGGDSKTCTKNKCDADGLRLECRNGVFLAAKSCEGQKICFEGECVDKKEDPTQTVECSTDRCRGKQIERCVGGKYQAAASCPGVGEVCLNDMCVPNVVPGKCTRDECSADGSLVECVSGEKQASKSCPAGQRCLLGECEAEATLAGACEDREFKSYCPDGDSLMTCKDGKVTKVRCATEISFGASRCHTFEPWGVGACVRSSNLLQRSSYCDGDILYEFNPHVNTMMAVDCAEGGKSCVAPSASEAFCASTCENVGEIRCDGDKILKCVAGGGGRKFSQPIDYYLTCGKGGSFYCNGGKVESFDECADGFECVEIPVSTAKMLSVPKIVCKSKAECKLGDSRCAGGKAAEICDGTGWIRTDCPKNGVCVKDGQRAARCAAKCDKAGVSCTEGEITDPLTGTTSTLPLVVDCVESEGETRVAAEAYQRLCVGEREFTCKDGNQKKASTYSCKNGQICNPLIDAGNAIAVQLYRCVDKCSEAEDGQERCDDIYGLSRCTLVEGEYMWMPFIEGQNSNASLVSCLPDGKTIKYCENKQVTELRCDPGTDCNVSIISEGSKYACGNKCAKYAMSCTEDGILACDENGVLRKINCESGKKCRLYGGVPVCTSACSEKGQVSCAQNGFDLCEQGDDGQLIALKEVKHFCDGNVLKTCSGGAERSEDCSATGAICADGACRKPVCNFSGGRCLNDGQFFQSCRPRIIGEEHEYSLSVCEKTETMSSACDHRFGCHHRCPQDRNVTTIGKCVKVTISGHSYYNYLRCEDGEMVEKPCESGKQCIDADPNTGEWAGCF